MSIAVRSRKELLLTCLVFGTACGAPETGGRMGATVASAASGQGGMDAASTTQGSGGSGGSGGAGGAGGLAEGAFTWPAKAGWNKETMTFPLDFAPDLGFHGKEELRFAPGFFTVRAPDFWSYAFAWWLEDAAPIEKNALAAALTDYFKGLSLAVGKGKFTFDQGHFQTTLDEGGPSDGEPGVTYEGHVETYDAFTTGNALTLRIRAHVFPCGKHQVVLIGASPSPNADAIWTDLGQVLSGFQCH